MSALNAKSSAPANMKRDCLFFVADKNIEAMVAGFLGRESPHLRLGCGFFRFDANQDLKVAAGHNDSGIFKNANALLQPYVSTHERVVVILDSAWSGSPGQSEITRVVEAHCVAAGWQPNTSCAIVIDPEIENWVWQDNIHVRTVLSTALNHAELKQALVIKQFWREGDVKPYQPKEAIEYLLKQNRIPRSSALYRKLASQVGIDGCTDSAFLNLEHTLQTWFPS